MLVQGHTATLNSTYKPELIRNPVVLLEHGPWRGIDDVEIGTAEWVDWHNHTGLHGRLGDIPSLPPRGPSGSAAFLSPLDAYNADDPRTEARWNAITRVPEDLIGVCGSRTLPFTVVLQ